MDNVNLGASSAHTYMLSLPRDSSSICRFGSQKCASFGPQSVLFRRVCLLYDDIIFVRTISYVVTMRDSHFWDVHSPYTNVASPLGPFIHKVIRSESSPRPKKKWSDQALLFRNFLMVIPKHIQKSIGNICSIRWICLLIADPSPYWAETKNKYAFFRKLKTNKLAQQLAFGRKMDGHIHPEGCFCTIPNINAPLPVQKQQQTSMIESLEVQGDPEGHPEARSNGFERSVQQLDPSPSLTFWMFILELSSYFVTFRLKMHKNCLFLRI